MKAALVFDDGPAAGGVHRHRMEALAAELTSRAHECALVGLGPTGIPETGDADLVVVDSYRVRADDCAFVRARIVGAVDDLARDLAVDLVIDPSPGAMGASHRRARRVLAGDAYAVIHGSGATQVVDVLEHLAST